MLLLKLGGKGLNYKSIKKYLGKRLKKRIIKDSILSKIFFNEKKFYFVSHLELIFL